MAGRGGIFRNLPYYSRSLIFRPLYLNSSSVEFFSLCNKKIRVFLTVILMVENVINVINLVLISAMNISVRDCRFCFFDGCLFLEVILSINLK